MRLDAMPPCLIGMDACIGARHLTRKLQAPGHDARLMPAKYVRECALGADDYGQRVTVAEAERWEALSKAAIDELAALRCH